MMTPKELSRGGDINKKLKVKSALARTEHSQITFFMRQSNLDHTGFVFSIVQYHVS